MVTDKHRAFARAVIALAREHRMGSVTATFHHASQTYREREAGVDLSREEVSMSWAEGRHGINGTIQLNTRAGELISEKDADHA